MQVPRATAVTFLALLAPAGLAGAGLAATHGLEPAGTKLRSFSAKKSSARTVTLRWRTTTEVGVIGFNVYRKVTGETRMRLIQPLLPAQSAREGAAYTYGDWLPKNAPARYWLQAVAGNGARTWLGTTKTG
jgi:hypothetical protein